MSQKILPILRKIVSTKEGTANLANVKVTRLEEKLVQLTKVPPREVILNKK